MTTKQKLKIFKISQTENAGYDTYDSAVVCAENEEKAKRIHPENGYFSDIFYNEKEKRFFKNCPVSFEQERKGPGNRRIGKGISLLCQG